MSKLLITYQNKYTYEPNNTKIDFINNYHLD